MADLRDFTGKNRRFRGTTGIALPTGTAAQRVDQSARFRFNSDTNLMEYYTGTVWKSVDAPPTVTGFKVNTGGGFGSTLSTYAVNSTTGGNITIRVVGSLFDTSPVPTVRFVPSSGATITPSSTTSVNANNVDVVTTFASFVDANEPYTIEVTNASNLSAKFADCITADTPVAFNNAADTTASIYEGGRGSVSITDFQATDADGDTITYSVTIGTLPSGLSINTSSGTVTGSTSAVGSNTTTTFTVQAATTDFTATRQFKITQYAPQRTTYNSPGTFNAPGAVTAVNVLVCAGGGGAGSQHAGAGGAGGLIFRPGFPISGGQPVSIGGGGPGGPKYHQPPPGSDSNFGSLTAKGGGGGGHGWPSRQAGKPGGSGGGASAGGGGSANQPGQGGDSGNYGHGHAGGGSNGPGSGGGGGAGGGGGTSNNHQGQPGGAGRAYSISGSSVTYAGGGGGGSHGGGPGSGGPGGGGRGGNHPGQPGAAGTNGLGGGGGGGGFDGGQGGAGGHGIVIVEY